MKSKKTTALIKGLETLLEKRGSMTVKEVQLLEEAIRQLEEHDGLTKEERMTSGVLIIQLLMRFLLDPEVSKSLTHLSSHLIDKLL